MYICMCVCVCVCECEKATYRINARKGPQNRLNFFIISFQKFFQTLKNGERNFERVRIFLRSFFI